jgi:hypothetical protein
MDMDTDLDEVIAEAGRTIRKIDEELEDIAWRLEKQAKDAPAATDLAAYVVHRSVLEDLRYRQVSLRLDKVMAVTSRQNARTRNIRRNVDRMRGQLGTMIDERLESLSRT